MRAAFLKFIMMVRFFIFIILFFSLGQLSAQMVDKLSVHKVTQALNKGKKITTEADCYYDTRNYKFVTRVTAPEKYIKIVNNKGELKMYMEKSNKLISKQNSSFSSFHEDLYYFVNNLYDDLGLKNEGFTLSETKYEKGYMINTWTPPATLKKISKLEMVFENMVPIYCAYFDGKGKITKKMYFSDYYQGSNLIMPQRITEISYTSKTDSIIKRIIYSDIKFNENVDDYYLNFKIPENAKLVK